MSAPINLVDSNPKGPNNLTSTEAKWRKACVQNDVSYALALEMLPKSDTYSGQVTIDFVYSEEKDPSASSQVPLFLDFVSKHITSLTINEQEIDLKENASMFSSNRLHVGKFLQNDTKNVIKVAFVNDYDHTGAGVHQFFDPVDQAEYIYTNFEPFGLLTLLSSLSL